MTSTTETPAATEATVRTWRVEYNATADGSFSETFVQADEHDRNVVGDESWSVFRREGRIVTELPDRVISLIEEMQPLDPSEREELESLRELIAALEDEQDAHLAKAKERLMGGSRLDDEQTDWAAYAACPACPADAGKQCIYAMDGSLRINPHKYRERLPAA